MKNGECLVDGIEQLLCTVRISRDFINAMNALNCKRKRSNSTRIFFVY